MINFKFKKAFGCWFFFVVVAVQTSAFAQVTVSANNTSIKQVIRQVEKSSGYSFFYSDDALDLDREITVNVKNESIESALRKIFNGTNIYYSIGEDKQISLTAEKEEKKDLNGQSVAQTQRKYSGIVVDANTGESIIGASVALKGDFTGMVTNIEGKFSIEAIAGSTLTVFYVGYAKQEVKLGDRLDLYIMMQENLNFLDEVVVVGYGTQKKTTLTGAVSSVANKDFIATRNENVVNSLTGKLPGVRITQNSSQPGSFNSSIDIRGLGSPLIVIDGVPRSVSDFSRLNSEEIESVSVLKDASAAIYGLHSANGVLLVTTKTGADQNGKVDISYSGNFAMQQFIYTPQTAGVIDYMTLKNEQQWMNYNSNYMTKQPAYWSQEAMQPYLDGSKQGYNWVDKMFRPLTPQSEQNLSVTGGNQKIRYYINLGYMKQDGSLRNDAMNYDRYNFRANMDAQITNRLKVDFRIGGSTDTKNEPLTYFYEAYKFAWVMRPTVSFYANDNPKYFNWDAFMPENINILADTDPNVRGYAQNKNYAFSGTAGLTYDIPGAKGLSAGVRYNYDARISDNTTLKRAFNIYRYDASTDTYNALQRNSPSNVSRYYGFVWNTLIQLSLNYKNSFGNHNVSGVLFYEENYLAGDGFSAYRELKLNSEYLFAGESENQRASGDIPYDRLTQSIVGRSTYDYKGKYLAEFSFRHDGSSRFSAGKRWGFFPAGFIGWRASEESFLKDNIDFLSNLKFRASYGIMGDDSSAGNYPPTVIGYGFNNYTGWFFNNTMVTGVSPTAVPNPNLTWYTSKMLNVGLDYDLWNGKLSGSLEVFRRNREGLLATSLNVIPGTVGASLPQENLNSDRTFGYEITLGHRNRWQGIEYFANAQLSATKSMWTRLIESPASNSYQYWTSRNDGRYKNIWMGYEALGQFQSYQDIWNSSTPTSASTTPGDWYYLDWNEDGQIDSNDSHPIATSNLPIFTYGLNLGASYKNWDMTMNLQGTYGVYVQHTEVLVEPLLFDGNALERFIDRWHPEDANADWFNPNTKWASGYYPITGHSVGQGSTAAVQNASYLRMKTMEIGYSIPKNLLPKVGIKNLRLYASGYNLLTFSGLKEMDPERPGGGLASYNYPNNRTFNLGVNIKF
ncbi:MAG: TonB-dependent receptor [Tannerella sp.]|jgi:TonB-linked SusC/RagA family outer membrane protein|nr:TonB-dependent receptor [Tannerella sp.]